MPCKVMITLGHVDLLFAARNVSDPASPPAVAGRDPKSVTICAAVVVASIGVELIRDQNPIQNRVFPECVDHASVKRSDKIAAVPTGAVRGRQFLLRRDANLADRIVLKGTKAFDGSRLRARTVPGGCMYQSFKTECELHVPHTGVPEGKRAWSVLLPFFNEEDYIAETINSLAVQQDKPVVVLIDNASTDASAIIAVRTCTKLDLPHVLVTERRPGKVAALAAGLAIVRTPYVATCDADTWYPPDYLQQAEALLGQVGCAAVGAYYADRTSDRSRSLRALHIIAASQLLPAQCHAGGAGQAFETASLRLAGGFDPARWNFVLEDHEVIHQVMKAGQMAYSALLWCDPSPRKRTRASVKWTLFERLVYIVTIAKAGDWFFERFLSVRFSRRNLSSERLRERPFQGDRPDNATPYPVR